MLVTFGTLATLRGVARPRQQHEESRTALLDAARRLLADEGPAALTVRRLASAAGSSTMAIYSRYGGKDGIVDELFIDGFQALAIAMNGAGPSADPLADLLACGRAYRRFALESPTSYAVMFQGAVPDYSPSERALSIAAGTLDQLAALIGRAMDAGLLDRADPAVVAAVVWSAQHGVVSLELAGHGPPGTDFVEVHRRANRALLRGLGAPFGPVPDEPPA